VRQEQRGIDQLVDRYDPVRTDLGDLRKLKPGKSERTPLLSVQGRQKEYPVSELGLDRIASNGGDTLCGPMKVVGMMSVEPAIDPAPAELEPAIALACGGRCTIAGNPRVMWPKIARPWHGSSAIENHGGDGIKYDIACCDMLSRQREEMTCISPRHLRVKARAKKNVGLATQREARLDLTQLKDRRHRVLRRNHWPQEHASRLPSEYIHQHASRM
jgi:hypothetical protein